MTTAEKLYNDEFKDIPDDQEGRLKYILGKKVDNKKYNEAIILEAKKIKKIKYNTIKFTMWRIVRPSARPRVTRQQGFMRMYVPRAAENSEWFGRFAKENELPPIDTPCDVTMRIYEKTPGSFSIKNKVLSELGLIRPWKRTGDFDNYAKTIGDMMQNGMLKDDCLIIDSHQHLYYSIKPRAEIEIKYMKSFPEY